MNKVHVSFSTPWHNTPSGPRPPNYRGFTITLWHTTLGRTDKWSARRRDLYLTTDIHDSDGIRTRNPSTQVAADPRLRPHGNWDRFFMLFTFIKFVLVALQNLRIPIWNYDIHKQTCYWATVIHHSHWKIVLSYSYLVWAPLTLKLS